MAERAASDLVDRCYRRALARRGEAGDAGTAVVGLRSLLAEVLTELGLPGGGRDRVAEPERRLVDFDPLRFGVALIDRQAPGRWHPEEDLEGGL